MQAHSKKFFKILFSILGSLLALLILGGAWLYSGELTPAKAWVFNAVPFPLALVNGHPVLMKDFLLRLAVSQKLAAAGSGALNQTLPKVQIYNQLVTEAETRQLAVQNGVAASPREIAAEYSLRAGQSDLQGKKNFEELLAGYGLSPADYQSQIIAPELLKLNLQAWFNSQQALNPGAYAQARDLADKIAAGQDMAGLAASSTQDATERNTGGDLGFVDPARMLPELRDGVAGMKPGEIKLLASRFGLHLIKVVETQSNNLHLREIFLQSGDFEAWFSGQTNNFKVRQLLKI